MYVWTIVICLASFIAGVIGFSGMAGSTAELFQLLFFVGLFVALLAPLAGRIALIWTDFLARTEDIQENSLQ